MSNHVTEWLNAYFDGELKGKRLYQVEEHLAECSACQAEFDLLQGLSALLHEVPAAEFVSHERFVSQVNLRLPQRQVKTTLNNVIEAGWWMIPIGIVAVWIFVSAAILLGNVVGVADSFGLLDNTTASWVSTPTDTVDLTTTLGQFGMLKDNNLQWAEVSEGYTRNVFPQIVLEVSIGLLYLTWFAVWWARRSRQGQGQLLEG